MPFSYSQIQTYRTCPKQYEYAYIKKIARLVSPSESFGTSMHNALKKWGELELRSKTKDIAVRKDQLKLFVAEEVTPKTHVLTRETLLQYWHDAFSINSYPNRIEADFRRNIGISALIRFYDWWSAEPREVIAVEKGFRITLRNGHILSGRLDRVEHASGGIRIIDFKTGHPRSQVSVDADLQLSLYALAVKQLFEAPCVELALLFLDEEGIIERKTLRNDSQMQDAEKSLGSIIARIEAMDYLPDPAYEKCKRCPYNTVCPASAA